MKEKKLAKQKMANAEHKVRVATAFRGNRETDLELQVGDEVTVLVKVRLRDTLTGRIMRRVLCRKYCPPKVEIKLHGCQYRKNYYY